MTTTDTLTGQLFVGRRLAGDENDPSYPYGTATGPRAPRHRRPDEFPGVESRERDTVQLPRLADGRLVLQVPAGPSALPRRTGVRSGRPVPARPLRGLSDPVVLTAVLGGLHGKTWDEQPSVPEPEETPVPPSAGSREPGWLGAEPMPGDDIATRDEMAGAYRALAMTWHRRAAPGACVACHDGTCRWHPAAAEKAERALRRARQIASCPTTWDAMLLLLHGTGAAGD